MNQIHTSYKVSKMLKEFLGESAPEPMDGADWVSHQYTRDVFMAYKDAIQVDRLAPVYQLHDLLSKPFCGYFAEKIAPIKLESSHETLSMILWGKYYHGGMEAVEKALTEMMEGK